MRENNLKHFFIYSLLTDKPKYKEAVRITLVESQQNAPKNRIS